MRLHALFLSSALLLSLGCQPPNDGPEVEGRFTSNSCGDGLVQLGEECDDANQIPGDGCENDCSRTRSICGNAILDPGELCDDGNTESGDGCRADCVKIEICGDGDLDAGELCDDGEAASGDGCRADCQGFERCGDGLRDIHEQCDDGNYDDGDGCSSYCWLESCGNGIVESGEECDDANDIDGDGCDGDCTLTACGNGILTAGEMCFPPRATIGTYSTPVDVERGDFDRDGDLDLMILNDDYETIQYFVNDGAGNFSLSYYFSTLLELGEVQRLSAADFNNDGALDLVVYGRYGSTVYATILANNGAGYLYGAWIVSLGSDPGASAAGIATGDFDRDGDLDIVVPANGVTVLRNDGGFVFSGLPQQASSSYHTVRAVAAGDFDGDGDDDIVANAVSPSTGSKFVYFLRNMGGMSFSVSGSGPFDFSALALGDFDGDSDLDLAGFGSNSVLSGALSVLENDGTGSFSTVTEISFGGGAMKEAAVVDIDNDGDLDLLGTYDAKAMIFLSQGGLQFSAPSFLPLGQGAQGITAGDFNGDGAADLAATNRIDRSLSLYRSQP